MLDECEFYNWREDVDNQTYFLQEEIRKLKKVVEELESRIKKLEIVGS